LKNASFEQQSSFIGFDFEPSKPIWAIYNGHTNSRLNIFLTPLMVTVHKTSQTYTGQGATATLNNPTIRFPAHPICLT